MRRASSLVILLALAGCTQHPEQINPGALVPVYLVSADDFATRFCRDPGYTDGASAYTQANPDAIWIVGRADVCTWQQAGTLCHEVTNHLASRYHGDSAAALAAISSPSFPHDTHGIGRLALKRQGVIQ